MGAFMVHGNSAKQVVPSQSGVNLDYMIRTEKTAGQMQHTLFLPMRDDGTWVLEELAIEYVNFPKERPYGFVLWFKGLNQDRECLGSRDDPLPVELLRAMEGSAGLTVMYLDDLGKSRCQILYADEPVARPRQREVA